MSLVFAALAIIALYALSIWYGSHTVRKSRVPVRVQTQPRRQIGRSG